LACDAERSEPDEDFEMKVLLAALVSLAFSQPSLPAASSVVDGLFGMVPGLAPSGLDVVT
jgi:hypothetical protein